MERISLRIDGMTCGHCVGAVGRALRELEGVELEGVEIGSATLRHDPTRTGVEKIVRALGEEGYTVRASEDAR
jgi:copper chaperone